ncbi:L-lactate dehydrogenase [Actinocorallia aurea]
MSGLHVGIVGAGAVGQMVAALLASGGWCDRLSIASGSAASADALVADLEDMLFQMGAGPEVQAVEVEAMREADAVVLRPRARFTNDASVDVRMAGTQANAPVIAALGRALAGYSGAVMVVTNPVDVMAALFARVSGAPSVFGIGSSTDTARYRGALARRLRVPVGEVSGRVIGEHGDCAVVCVQSTRVRGNRVEVPLADIRAELRERPARISRGIGRTRIGPAGAVVLALRAALGLADGVVELSVPAEGVGVPVRFTGGTASVQAADLSPGEVRELARARTKQRRALGELSTYLQGGMA